MTRGICQPNGNLPTEGKADTAGTSVAQLTIAKIKRRLSGAEPHDPQKIAKHHALLVAPIDARERKLAEAERHRLRAKYRTEHSVLTLVQAIKHCVEQGRS